jgi:hypothetical protein
MHAVNQIQRHVQAAPFAASRVRSNALLGSDSMADIGWTCGGTRKPSFFKSEGDSNTEITEIEVTSG